MSEWYCDFFVVSASRWLCPMWCTRQWFSTQCETIKFQYSRLADPTRRRWLTRRPRRLAHYNMSDAVVVVLKTRCQSHQRLARGRGRKSGSDSTESGADDAAVSNHPHQLILMKPHGRLRCTDRRREVGRDWPEQRCAPPVAPTDPSALTCVRLRACAAGHSNIDKASSGQAGDPRSLADIMAHDYGRGWHGGADVRASRRLPVHQTCLRC